ncbi:MAG: DNA polymerase III subunit beta [Myxococcales bacterium]|nr:DNA polymerase III subunit beta [Myxococcales bacterium]
MEFFIQQAELVKGLHRVQGIVDKKSTLTVLSHVLIESLSDSEIRISCTDYDASLVGVYPAEVLKQGSVAISGKSLFDIVRSLPGERVHISADASSRVEVKAGSSFFRIAGIAADEFPKVADAADVSYVTFDAQSLLEMIERTHFSMSSDETRMNLNGVFFEIGNQSARMVSTDGHRLSKAEVALPLATELQATGILHKKGVYELRRLLAGEGECQVGFKDGSVYLKVDTSTMIVRQIDDDFPDYQKVIPADNEVTVEVSRGHLFDALKRMSLVTSNKTWGVKVELKPDLLVVASSQPDLGEGREELPVAYVGRELVIGYNLKYLLDVLGALKGETVNLSTNDEYSAMVITSNDEPGTLFVIMPMRI